MTSEIKPAAFKRGVPKEQKNGIYGLEQDLMGNPQELLFAVVSYRVDEIVNNELAGERYPVLELHHVEPLRSEQEIEAGRRLQESAYKARTGANELSFDFGDVDDDDRGEGGDD